MAAGLMVGCFDPSVENGGFSCLPDQAPACPRGFYCVNHRCVNQPGVSTDTDLSATPTPPDMTQTITPPQPDLTMMMQNPQPDLTQPMTPPDLMQPPMPPDLAKPPTMCAHSPCVTGVKLIGSCDPCVAQVCANDPMCCNSAWDGVCVNEAGSSILGVCTNPACP